MRYSARIKPISYLKANAAESSREIRRNVMPDRSNLVDVPTQHREWE